MNTFFVSELHDVKLRKIKVGAVVDKVKYPSNPTVFRAVVLDSHS